MCRIYIYSKSGSTDPVSYTHLDEAAEFLIQRETITGKEFMEIFNKYKNPVEESDKNVSETAENDACLLYTSRCV